MQIEQSHPPFGVKKSNLKRTAPSCSKALHSVTEKLHVAHSMSEDVLVHFLHIGAADIDVVAAVLRRQGNDAVMRQASKQSGGEGPPSVSGLIPLMLWRTCWSVSACEENANNRSDPNTQQPQSPPYD